MARPATPWGNSISSPAMTLSSPWTRAIPSPREMTVPTSSTWMRWSKFSICWRSSSVISSALICAMSSFYSIRVNSGNSSAVAGKKCLRVHKLLLQLLQLRADGTVVHRGPNVDHSAAQQAWVLKVGSANAAARQLRNLRLKLGAILIVQRTGAGHLCLRQASLIIRDSVVFGQNLIQLGETLVIHDDRKKVSNLGKHADASSDRVEDLQLLLVRNRRVHQNLTQLAAAGKRPAEVGELLFGRGRIQVARRSNRSKS